MFAALFALAVLLLGPGAAAEVSRTNTVPTYSVASIVNAATSTPGYLAPNTIASIYGTDLSYNTATVAYGATSLPRTLGGVTVYFGRSAANLYFVSPRQINVLVPNDLLPGPVDVLVIREGASGAATPVTLLETAPGLLQLSPGTVAATHANGSPVTLDTPASAGEVVVLYAVGLGRTFPDSIPGQVATRAQPIQHLPDLQVLVGGKAVNPANILYAGSTPGFAGLYQINIRLPDGIPATPEVRIGILDQMSPASCYLPSN